MPYIVIIDGVEDAASCSIAGSDEAKGIIALVGFSFGLGIAASVGNASLGVEDEDKGVEIAAIDI
jgi:hypothetical protein